MEKIESFLKNHPILSWLSGEELPKTDRPLIFSRSLSKMSGSVLGIRWKALDSQSWLSTDEIQFLFAFFLRNQEGNQFFHVLGPAITNKVAIVQEAMTKILEDTATAEDHQAYEYNIEGIQDYMDSKLDLFEHKFLVFLCNESHTHWVSVVVVNPFLVYDPYLVEGTRRTGVMGDDDFVGWSVFNSNQRQHEKMENGFQGTMFTKNKASYGVQLFLNIGASYLKAKKLSQGDGRQRDNFCYESPFGEFSESKGTGEFPRFDYESPSILGQSNAFDCGLAAVANSMAFVIHSKDVPFMKANMERDDGKLHEGSNEVRFFLKEEVYSLKGFWEKVMEDAAQQRYGGNTSTAQHVLAHMRQEYIEIVDEIASASVTNEAMYN
jgi:hypothetical protein